MALFSLPGIAAFFITKLTGIGAFLNTARMFIVKHWKAVIVASMALFIVYQNQFATRFLFGINTIPHLERVIEDKNKMIAERDGIIANLNKIIDDTVAANKRLADAQIMINQQVDKWKKISKQLEEKNNLLGATIRKMRKEHQKEIDAILNSPTPQTCEESMNFLREHREQLTWSEEQK